MVTDSAFYLYNTNYPSNMSSTIRSCQCQISTTGTNIQFYSVDMRLHKYNNECKQTFNISDSDGVTSWDCDSAPIFNVTSVPKNQAMTLTFTNYLPVNGGNIWIGFSGRFFFINFYESFYYIIVYHFYHLINNTL